MTIFLIGYMGSGKSTVGKKLASVLNFEYVDLDFFIENKEGKSVSELFSSKGEIYFRKVESRYLKELLSKENTIVSLGGGTPCYGNNMQIISEANDSKSIYLKASIPNLVERVFGERKKRPLIAHLENKEELIEFIGKHLFERSYYYQKADVTISVDDKSVNTIVEDIVKALF